MRCLLIDDFRNMNVDRTERTYEAGLRALKEEKWDELYLDHDIGACEECTSNGTHIGDMLTPATTFMNTCEHSKTGYDILCWLEVNTQYLPGKIIPVTANPVGRDRMNLAIEKIYRGR